MGRGGIVFIDSERFPKQASPWANPYKTGDHILERYKEYIVGHIKRKTTRFAGCKVPNITVPCHGDILMEFLNN